MNPSRRTYLLFAAATITMGAPLPVAAQTATFASLTEAERNSITAAEKLEAEARDLSAGPGWASAARLYRNAAELRGAGDFTAADNLRLAGYIGFYEGRLVTSVVVLTRAADAFLAGGDVLSAASTLADAAWVAVQAGDGLEAQALRDRALLLTRSPLLAAADRETLVRRRGAEKRRPTRGRPRRCVANFGSIPPVPTLGVVARSPGGQPPPFGAKPTYQ